MGLCLSFLYNNDLRSYNTTRHHNPVWITGNRSDYIYVMILLMIIPLLLTGQLGSGLKSRLVLPYTKVGALSPEIDLTVCL